LLEETPLLKKLHLGSNLDLIIEIASEMKVVTLKQGYDLPLNKSGMYLLVDGQAVVTRDCMNTEQQQYINYINQHQGHLDYDLKKDKVTSSVKVREDEQSP
jgi:hypothetical protein